MVRAGGRSKTKASYADPEDSEESGVSEDDSDSRRNSSPSKKSKSKKSKKEVSIKLCVHDRGQQGPFNVAQ